MMQKRLILFFTVLSFYNSSFAQIPAAGNVLWLKADAAVYTDAGVTPATNGQAVQQWNDQSGLGNNVTQTTAIYKPTFQTAQIGGQSSIYFDGAAGAKFLNNTTQNLVTAGAARTTFIVSKINSNSVGATLFTFRRSVLINSLSLGKSGGVAYVNTDGANGSSNAAVESPVVDIAKNPFIASWVTTSGSKTAFRFNTVDQLVVQSGTATTESGTTGFTVGGREDYANWWEGLISEVIVYNRILTLAETQQVESYLQTKYGITCGANGTTKPGSGNAGFYPGTGSYGSYTPDSEDWNFGSGDFGIECWLNPGGSGQDNCIMTQSVGGAATAGTSSFYFGFNYGTANSMAVGFYTTTGTTWNNVIYTANNALVQSKWQHVAVIRKAGVTKIYVDGIDKTLGGTVAATIPNGSQPLEFGMQNFTSYFGGSIDEVRIYKGAAPDQTTLRDWMCKKTAPSHPYYANMVANYNFDEDAGRTFAIDKINCHNMYFLGATEHRPSGAALGNTSAYQYATNNATANINFGTPTDNLSVTMNAGTSEGVHVYGVNELPNNSNYPGLIGNNKYGGVYVVKGNAGAAYDAVYNYTNNTAVTAGIEPSLKLFKRTDNAATTWTQATPQTLNTTAKTITATGQNTEYVLGSAVTAVAPVCYGTFNGGADMLTSTAATAANGAGDNAIAAQVFDNFTYEVWVKPTAALGGAFTSDRYVIYPVQANSIGQTGIGIGVAIGTDGIRVWGHTVSYAQIQLGYNATITSWTHVAVVVQNQIPTIFINGLAVATGTTMGTCRATASYLTANFYGVFTGSTTDFRLWNYARTGAQINANMNAVPAGNSTGLVANYTFTNLYNGNGQLVKSNATNFPVFQTDLITAGSITTPAFNCTGQNLPLIPSPTCGIKLDGTSRVDVGNLGAMPDKGTIEFFMNQPSFSDWQIPVSTIAFNTTNTDGIYFETFATGQLIVAFGNGPTNQTFFSYGNLIANRTYHVAVTWDLTALTYKGYLDGRLIFVQPLVYYPATLPRLTMGAGYNSGRYYNGTIDEVRYWNVERTQSEIINNAYAIAGTETGLQAYYHFNDNTFGGNGKTVLNKCTATGAALNGVTVSANGYPKFPCSLNPPTCGIKFSGAANEGVQVAYNTALNLTTAYTYEAWVKPSTNITNYRSIIGRGAYPNYKPGLFVNGNADALPGRFSASFVIGGIAKGITSTSAINDNEWHHVATTYDGANMKIYVDGNLENTVAATGALATSTEPLGIGYNYAAANYPFIGNMDEVRIWNTARTAAELQAAMNAGLAGTETGLVGYYNFSNNNRSGQNRTVTNFCTATGVALNGTTTGTSLTPVFECAPPPFTTPECNMQLNGTTDYAQAANVAAISVTQFSAGAYFKTSITGTTKTILLKDVNGTNYNYQLSISSANKAIVSFTNTSSTIITATGTTTITDGNWHYAVGTYDGANLKIYVDGVLEATTANATTPMTGTNALNIGAGNGGLNRYNGSIDELSVWNTALSLSQIQSFIGQRLLGYETGLVAYYNFGGNTKNGQGITIVNSCTTTGAALNATTAGTATTPIFTCSEIIVTPPTCNLLMNGITDRAYVNGTAALSYPGVTNNFTMEVKAKALYPKGSASGAQYDGVSSGQNYVLFPDQGGDGFAPGHAGVGISLGTNGIAVYEHSTNYMPARIAFNNYNTNDWVHLTLVSSNGVLKLYINGALVSTASASGYVLHPSGHIGGYYGTFAGYVGEVRIWNAALNADQIRTNLNANLVGNETNLISLFKFNNNASNGTNKTITGLGSFGSANPYITLGTNCTPIFTCANTTAVNRDSVVGSGNMLSQNGSGISFAELGDLGNIPVQGSMMVWFNAASLKEKAFVFSTAHFRNSVGRYKGINLFTRNDGKLQLTFGTDTTATGFQDTVTVSTNITAGKWYHFAMSWDTVAKTYTTYLNGIQTASGSTNFWPLQFESFKAGIGLQPSSTNTWNGQIDELSEWNKILSVTEIRNQLASKINTTQANYTNVLHYYRFDNNTCGANAINDYKGTVHGMIYNTSLPVSSAPIGDTSRYDYNGIGSFAKVTSGLSDRDTLSATILTGTNVQGVHVYGINEKPNTQNGQLILANNNRYGGVFVVGDTNQLNYNFKYSYAANPFVLPSLVQNQLLLYKRQHNADGTWVVDFTAVVDSIAKTYTTIGRNTEYMLGYSTLPVRPNLGNDTTVYIVCANDTRRIDTLYNTSGLTFSWSTNPLAAPLGTHTLMATSSFGFSDTAVVFVKQEVAVWTGTISSDWHNAANWNHGKVPTLTVHVIIPTGTPNFCEISNADAEAASVQALSGNFSIVNNRKLLIAANCPALPVAQ